MGEVDGICFHEMAVNDFLFNEIKVVVAKDMFLQEVPVLHKVPVNQISYKQLPRIPDKQYLNYKVQINLYILKDQFLI